MKKVILLAVIGLGHLTYAQQNNEKLKQELETKRLEKHQKIEAYLQKKATGSFESEQLSQLNHYFKNYVIQNQSNIAFFFNGEPYFLEPTDTDQIKNGNVDFIQEGKIEGLNNDFSGNGIHVSVFDGGRAYAQHIDFLKDDQQTRVTNKEADIVPYSSHATGVTGMIGARGHNLSGTLANGTKIEGNTKGMAPNATFDVYSFRQTTLPNENTPKTVDEKILASQANISNHSYGIPVGWRYIPLQQSGIWYWNGYYNPSTHETYSLDGAYVEQDKISDDIVYHNPSMIVVKSAGNSFGDGPFGNNIQKIYGFNNGYYIFNNTTDIIPDNNCWQGYDCIGPGSLAKNLIIVGSTEKITQNGGRYAKASDVIKSSFSSAGPRDDGAIKPDIAGVGSNVFYPSTSTRNPITWGRDGGTSFSAPQVTGIIALWTEINKSLFNNQLLNAASAKTLLIHSALEAGNKGPDAHFGWGFANAKKGAELLVDKSNNKIIFEDKSLKNNTKDEILVESDGTQPLKVTISWTDPSFKNVVSTFPDAHNNRTSKLVNDLDLRIINTKTNQVYYPWKLDINTPLAPATTGDNLVDNVEQVVVEKPEPGMYIVEVSHKGNLVNNDDAPKIAPQDYSILVSGYNRSVSDNLFDSSSFNIFPTLITDNDPNKTVTISFSDRGFESVSVYDMSGRLLKQESINGGFHNINFSSYPKGVYIINIVPKKGSETISRKVVIR